MAIGGYPSTPPKKFKKLKIRIVWNGENFDKKKSRYVNFSAGFFFLKFLSASDSKNQRLSLKLDFIFSGGQLYTWSRLSFLPSVPRFLKFAITLSVYIRLGSNFAWHIIWHNLVAEQLYKRSCVSVCLSVCPSQILSPVIGRATHVTLEVWQGRTTSYSTRILSCQTQGQTKDEDQAHTLFLPTPKPGLEVSLHRSNSQWRLTPFNWKLLWAYPHVWTCGVYNW
jgi:hypothetical protein